MTQGKYANVNGLKMYYEIHGVGRPLVEAPATACYLNALIGCFR
jgi:hypothetical protein